jgi:hypothetical protein
LVWRCSPSVVCLWPAVSPASRFSPGSPRDFPPCLASWIYGPIAGSTGCVVRCARFSPPPARRRGCAARTARSMHEGIPSRHLTTWICVEGIRPAIPKPTGGHNIARFLSPSVGNYPRRVEKKRRVVCGKLCN